MKNTQRSAKIYLIFDLTGKSAGYVGWTVKTIQRRLREHCLAAFHDGQFHVHRAIRKLSYNVGVRLLEDVPEDASPQELEKSWIKRYRDLGWHLWNMTDGGDGWLNETQEVKEKRSRSLLQYHRENPNANTRTEQTKRLMSRSQKLRWLIPGAKEELSLKIKQRYLDHPDLREEARRRSLGEKNNMYGVPSPMKGKKTSRSTRKKQSKARLVYYSTNKVWNLGKKQSLDERRRRADSLRRYHARRRDLSLVTGFST